MGLMADRTHLRLPPGQDNPDETARTTVRVSSRTRMDDLTRRLQQRDLGGDYTIEYGADCYHYAFSDSDTAKQFKAKWG